MAEGARGVEILVPEGWTLLLEDGSGPGSTSTWSSPDDPDSQVVVFTGVALGGWYELDGVRGSIDPTGMLPDGAQIIRYSNAYFAYMATLAESPYPAHGVWIAFFEADGAACCFSRAEVHLPPAQQPVATEILNDFVARYG